MTPEQIALQALRVQEIQTWITGLAIFIGPLAGVLFTLWFQSRKERCNAKLQLFLALMSERKSHVISKEITKALNQIDVVFADFQEIKALWHKYYSLLSVIPGEERTHTWIELLAAIAKELNYRGLSQVDLDKFYIPQGHVDQAEFQSRMAGHWERVLQNTERFFVTPIANRET